MQCPVCGNSLKVCDRDYQKIQLYKCDACKLGASEISNTEFYDDGAYFDNWTGTYSEEHVSDNTMFLDLIRRYKSSGRLLDIGTGTACLPATAMKQGFLAEGTDISRFSCDTVQGAVGVKMHHGFLEDIVFTEKYDVITMIHVLEHTINPRTTLEKAKSILEERGVFLLVVPNCYTPTIKLRNVMSKAGLSSKRYRHLAAHHHNWFFSLQSLVALCEKHGFDVVHKTTLSSRRKQGFYYELLSKFDVNNWACVLLKTA